MYRFNGTLIIKRIMGHYGEFVVGTIQSPIGDFSVKQAELEQYDEGLYEGKFSIGYIEPVSNVFGSNKLVLEMRATLNDIVIKTVDETEIAMDVESDPITEEQDQPAAVQATTETETVKDSLDDDLHNLFDAEQIAAIQANTPVALDMTQSRDLIRQQIDYLKQHNWKFNPKEKTWYQP